MNLSVYRLRVRLAYILKRLGLLTTVWSAWRASRILSDSEFRRREYENHQQYHQFKQNYHNLFTCSLINTNQKVKRALVVSYGSPAEDICVGLFKALELANFAPIILLKWEEKIYLNYYKLANIKESVFWSKFPDPSDLVAAKTVVNQIQSIDEFLNIEFQGAHIGRYAMNTALRHLRMGTLDLQSAKDRQILIRYIAKSMKATNDVHRILQKIRPELVLLLDPVYSPEGELFDICLAKGIVVIKAEPTHKSNTLMLKRYNFEIRNEHPASLSSDSWQLLGQVEWKEAYREQLRQEIYRTYANGDWYNVVWGTSYKDRLLDANNIRKLLSLDPNKKTAIIFPHILWDAPFTWGNILFDSYEEWFIKTVSAACMNNKVNWVIKIHPANIGKAMMDHYRGEPAEVLSLRKHFNKLPPHIFLLPVESGISTFSLYSLMDYCITARGTVGIEAASLGIPVLTAGRGRYDHRGFTIDSNSRDEYLQKLAHITEIQRLSSDQLELAERYAYGIFVLRPLPLETVTIEYLKDRGPEDGFNQTRININTKEDWYSAPDLMSLAQWLESSNQTDYLKPFPVY